MAKVEVGEVFSISDDNGEEQEVEVLGVITLEGIDYAAVAFADEVREESDDEFTKVSYAFEKMMDEEED